MGSISNRISQYGKNLLGWSTPRQLVVFSVDDYGTIRMASEQARQNLKQKGLLVDSNRFDQYDCLENAEDLSQLFDVLSSVRDGVGKPAVFTAYSLPANIDFDRMQTENFQTFQYKLLTETFASLPGYEAAWKTWMEGITEGLMSPEFHGREHVNVPLLMRLLGEKNEHVLSCFDEHSWGGLERSHPYRLSYTASFDFETLSQNSFFQEIIHDGLNAFEIVFKKRARCFNAPGVPAHKILEKELMEGGVRYVDSTFIKKEHQGEGKFNYMLNYLGKRNANNQRYLMRNAMFEPGLNQSGSVEQCLTEIDAAFTLHKPANISSHRVNFSGGINPAIREHGLSQLWKLLHAIVKRWPKVEFVSASQLGAIIEGDVSKK